MVSTLALADSSFTMTETSPLFGIDGFTSPYQKAKAAAYYEAMGRAALGANLAFVFPGALYGPSPFVSRAVHPTLFTGALLKALRGELTRYASFPLTWPWIEDAALITLRAIDDEGVGLRHLAAGRSEDAMSLAQFCNLACEFAGVPHRVADLGVEALGDELGVMRRFAERKVASPMVDASATNRRLGITLTPVATGVERTVAWMRDHRLF